MSRPITTGFKYGNPGVDVGSQAVSWEYLDQNYRYLPMTLRRGGLYTCGTNTLLSGQVSSSAVWSQYNNFRFRKISGVHDRNSDYNFLIGLRDDGTLWSVGTNHVGQLGLGDTTTRTSWTQIGSDNTWIDVEASCDNLSLSAVHALKSNNTLWSWGNDNASGRFSSGQFSNYTTTPTQHTGTWKYICTATRKGYRYIIDTNGVAYGWGTAADYTLYVNANVGGTTTVFSPSAISGSYNTNIKQVANSGALGMIDENGNAYYAQSENFTDVTITPPIPVPNDTGDWDQIAVIGTRNSATLLGIKRNGTFWYYRIVGGTNQWVYTGVSNVKKIYTENYPFTRQIHLLTRSGRLFIWGYSDYFNLYDAADSSGNYLVPQFRLKTKETNYYGGSITPQDLSAIPDGRVISVAKTGGNSDGSTLYISLETGDY